MTSRFLDLHIHSTASDGSDSPSAIVHSAAALGLSAIALTDHDTLDGLDEAAAAAISLPLEFIRGVEISIATPLECEVHLLGLWLPAQTPPALASALEGIRRRRAERNDEMLARMRALGLPLTHEHLVAAAGGRVIGRPHMAKALLELGLVKSLREAFDRYLGANGAAWAPRVRMPADEALALLKQAGAVTCLAHPCLIRCNHDALARLVASLVPLGLDALEAYHSRHSPADEALCVKLAAQYSLALSGGSDYHGSTRPGTPLGSRFPAVLLPALRARKTEGALPPPTPPAWD